MSAWSAYGKLDSLFWLITLFGVCVLRVVWLVTILKIYPGLNTLILSYPVTWYITAVVFIIYYSVRKKNILKRV